ncbi:MAG: hypothetical protein PVF58_05025 [Candidatus Methanofastidiosia archaeon]|jgi:hypothetical protein
MEKSNEINLEKMEQKAYQESMQDGLTEVLLGILLVGMGALFNIKSFFPAFFAVFVIFVFPRILERLKRRYTYPRIGYAKLHEDPPKTIAVGIFSYMLIVVVVMVVVLFVIFSGISADLWYRWTPTFMGAMLTGALIYLAGKSGDSRNYGIALLGLVTGIVLSGYPFEFMWTGLIVYLLVMGSLFIGLGLVRFGYFVHTFPVQEDVIDE